MEDLLNYEEHISCHLSMHLLLNKIFFYTHFAPKMSGPVIDKFAYVRMVT